jgi:hypothetical protein
MREEVKRCCLFVESIRRLGVTQCRTRSSVASCLSLPPLLSTGESAEAAEQRFRVFVGRYFLLQACSAALQGDFLVNFLTLLLGTHAVHCRVVSLAAARSMFAGRWSAADGLELKVKSFEEIAAQQEKQYRGTPCVLVVSVVSTTQLPEVC